MYLRSNQSGAAAALTLAVALCGCGNSNSDFGSGWFSKPVDLFGRNSGYTYAQLGETRQDRPVTASDLVDANGACPAVAPPPTQSASAEPGQASAAPPGPPALGGVGIGMSECEVVARLGQPAAVNLGAYANGTRTAVLTFNGGPRPGIYRFVGGRLTEMDRVEEPAPPDQPVKKKPAKAKPQKTNDNT